MAAAQVDRKRDALEALLEGEMRGIPHLDSPRRVSV
jgi:hypothetical protein